MQQQMFPMAQPIPPTANITTEQIQKYLDENKKLIMAIMENQNLGKLAECAQYQALLQKNLMYLAAIADAQPPPPTSGAPPTPPMASQMTTPHPAMQPPGYFMQQQASGMVAQQQQASPAGIFPHPRGPPMPFGSPLQLPDMQQLQQQQQQQHMHQQAMQGHMGIRAMNNNGHPMQQQQPESAHGGNVGNRGNKQEGEGKDDGK